MIDESHRYLSHIMIYNNIVTQLTADIGQNDGKLIIIITFIIFRHRGEPNEFLNLYIIMEIRRACYKLITLIIYRALIRIL